jgi:hypothetical protein
LGYTFSSMLFLLMNYFKLIRQCHI